MNSRTIRDATKALQSHFSAAKIPLGLPSESRRMLQTFVEDETATISEEESDRANTELKLFWEKYVGESPQKLGAFVGVLRELRPAIVGEDNIIEWYQLVIKPVIAGTGYRKSAIEDAREFLVGAMANGDEEETTRQQANTSKRLCTSLLGLYVSRSRGLTDADQFVAPENGQVTQQVEDVLIAFGRKQPKDLFNSIDDLLRVADSRLQALTLLSSFLRHQTPHLYLVTSTPLVDTLLKCLMNDTSTTILSVAMTSLIMILPHIPGSLVPHLPRLFLIYSRLLCWEKFSPLSTDEQKDLVTDDRVTQDSDEEQDHCDVGIDPSWQKFKPVEGTIEVTTPELLTLFTYLYGLYPLNFMNYIRRPRRYLKNIEFPGADDFDLDRAVIRSRTDQFRQLHLLHPNFYNMTADEELSDPKWPAMDPADVVGDCHRLCISTRPSLISPGPPPSSKLPELPQAPPFNAANNRSSEQPSPAVSSLKSGSGWRDNQSATVSTFNAEGDSPVLRPQGGNSDDDVSGDLPKLRSKGSTHAMRTSSSTDDLPQPATVLPLRSPKEKLEPPPQTNLAYLQREIAVLRNELNFERWHKAHYSQHISQIMRKNVKDATAEAETLNLINANRLLKQQLEQVRKAREATIKDSALTRKQANSLEASMTDRFGKMKLEQETWQAESDELRRLRSETKQYRELLVTAEAKELNRSHELELMKRDLARLQKIEKEMKDAQRKLHDYEYREFEFDHAIREKEILLTEKETLKVKLEKQEHDREQLRRAYAEKVVQLEVQAQAPDSRLQRRGSHSSGDTHHLQQSFAENQSRLAQLKKAHSRLLEKYTDLELEYQYVKTQLDTLQGFHSAPSAFSRRPSDNGSLPYLGHERPLSGQNFDIASDYGSLSEASAFAPNPSRFHVPAHALPVSPPKSEANYQTGVGLTWKPPPVSSKASFASKSSGQPVTFNQSAPLTTDESKSAISEGSSLTKKEKIQVDSQVRVYGRGGAQNIKLKQKDKKESDSGSGKKSGAFKGLRNLVQ